MIYGTTVKAIAVKGQDGFENSEVASEIYVPEGGSGIGGDVVILDDREDHSWSYYSDPNQPIHSLNPADVKITYKGYGDKTMTTTDTGNTPTTFDEDVDSEAVAVGPNDPGNQFVYLKTLEKANEDGSGNYPYTTIPNPFSKRPTYGTAPATRNIYISTIQDYAFGYVSVTYFDANGQQMTWGEQHIYWDGNTHVPSTTITVKSGTTITVAIRTADWVGTNSEDPNNVHPGNVQCILQYDNEFGEEIGRAVAAGEVPSQNNTYAPGVTDTQNFLIPGTDYRGFYAWRVKRISNGLEIKRANGNTVNVGGIINAEEAIQFVTTSEYGNEVDFEALWAKAYVATYVSDNAVTVTNTAVGFERNFVVLARNNNDFTLGGDNNRLNNPYNRAVTISSYYPDGTVGANRCGIDFGGDLDLNYDLKLEYVQNNDYANSEYYINANGHYLCIGRGMTTGSTIAAQINAIRGDVDGSDTTH